jgi:predicted transcriptional regulator
MIETSAEKRISVRVDPDVHDEIQRIADRRYEGKYAMAAREAFRLFIMGEREVDAAQAERHEEQEVA